jgi:PKD repeat protein
MPTETTGLLRPLYFDRQQLTAADLTAGQDYLRARLRRHNRYLHGWGVVCGIEVSAQLPWHVQVGAGFALTPQGDEIEIPTGVALLDIQAAVAACLKLPPPCPDPEDFTVRDVKIVRANLDPVGKDQHGDYNREWVEIQVQRPLSLAGYTIQHTINPGTPQQAFAAYYHFDESTSFAKDALIRIHSGAQAQHQNPEPNIVHRYVARSGQVGNWRLNNVEDTFRILDATGRVVDERRMQRPVVYLMAYPDEANTCAQPRLPQACQPAGGEYAWSRAREGVRFEVVCTLPPSHQVGWTCSQLEEIVCGNAHAPCPPTLTANDNGVVLASIIVGDNGIVEVDEFSDRRRLLSEALLLAHLRCQCGPPPAPLHADFTAEPLRGRAPLTVQFTDTSTGEVESWTWEFGDGSGSTARHPAHVYPQPGVYDVSLTVTGRGGLTDILTRAAYITVRGAFSPCAERILERGRLVVGTPNLDAWPFFAPGQRSFVPNLLMALSQRIFGAPLPVEVAELSVDAWRTALAAGEVPADLFMPLGLIRDVNDDLWTHPFFMDGIRLLIETDTWQQLGIDVRAIETIPQWIDVLRGRDLVLGLYSDLTRTLQIVLQGLGLSLQGIRIETFDRTAGTPVQILGRGGVHAFAGDWIELLSFVEQTGVPGRHRAFPVVGPIWSATVRGRVFGRQVHAMAVAPECLGLRDEISNVLQDAIQAGQYLDLFRESFPAQPPWTMAELLAASGPTLLPGIVPGDEPPFVPDPLRHDLVRGANEPIETIQGLGPARGRRLRSAGITSVLELATLPAVRVAELGGVPLATARDWQRQAAAWMTRP